MKDNGHKNWIYPYRISSIRASWIIQMSNIKHVVEHLSVWFIQTFAKYFPFLLFHHAGYSKWRNSSAHMLKTLFDESCIAANKAGTQRLK
jgi:hypothetical protein